VNKERVTYTDEEFEGLEEKELLAYINYLQQKCEDHKAAAEKIPKVVSNATRNPRLRGGVASIYPGDSRTSRRPTSYSVTSNCQR